MSEQTLGATRTASRQAAVLASVFGAATALLHGMSALRIDVATTFATDTFRESFGPDSYVWDINRGKETVWHCAVLVAIALVVVIAWRLAGLGKLPPVLWLAFGLFVFLIASIFVPVIAYGPFDIGAIAT